MNAKISADTGDERLRRWRLILGGGDADGTGSSLEGRSLAMDRTLEGLYDDERQGGLGSSAPRVARWLGDIREYFPASVVSVMQRDAMERLNLRHILTQPELLASVEPDIHVVATLISLKSVLPGKTRETARQVVRKVVEDIQRRLAEPLRQAVRQSLDRSARTRRPRHHEIDWQRTIRANLKHYQPKYKTIIPDTLIGFGRRGTALRDIILCLDQSGSMAASVVYAGVFGAVMGSLRSVRTRVVGFDTSVVDLSHLMSDPVDLIFGVQLGGGTDINRALTYCETLVENPRETILVLISDLIEGGNRDEMIGRVQSLLNAGVQVIALLALSDQGKPSYDHEVAARLAGMGVPAFACTPDLFPELMAAAIQKQDIAAWASARGISATPR